MLGTYYAVLNYRHLNFNYLLPDYTKTGITFFAVAAHASSWDRAQQNAPSCIEEDEALDCSRDLRGALLNAGAARTPRVLLRYS